MKFKLVQTCGACPEAYDVYFNDEKVGYMRLRHGHFRAEYKGETVYTAQPNGDGIFEYDERNFYLNSACRAIKQAMEREELPPEQLLFEIE